MATVYYRPGQVIGVPGTPGSVFGGIPGQYGVTQGVMQPIYVDNNGNVVVQNGEHQISTVDGGMVSTQTRWYQRGNPRDYRGSSGNTNPILG